jgi:DNA-binding NtrC family response regulator
MADARSAVPVLLADTDPTIVNYLTATLREKWPCVDWRIDTAARENHFRALITQRCYQLLYARAGAALNVRTREIARLQPRAVIIRGMDRFVGTCAQKHRDDGASAIIRLRPPDSSLFVEHAFRALSEGWSASSPSVVPPPNAGSLVGSSTEMHLVRELIARYGPTEHPVLITGETGTGKELVAQSLHAASPRAKVAFLPVNCSELDGPLINSTLFGHRRGAFTGATDDAPGLFAAADGGTLFLDEIGELALPLQGRLLRVLQEGRIRPVGEVQERSVDVRLIAATHADLLERVRQGTFREDLYYRLSVLRIHIPRLNDRRSDIPDLVRHILADRKPITFEALRLLQRRHWSGNVRELQNVLSRALVHAGDHITPADL